MHQNINKIKLGLLVAGMFLCLLQIWLPAYFVTGDGACHLYNAQILHDLWGHKNMDYYTRFYQLLSAPNPNWFTSVCLTCLLFLAKGVIAEKVFITLYLFVYVTGCYRLLNRLSGNNSYWPAVAIILVFNHLLTKGFYNFSFSIAFLLWFIEVWLAYMSRRQIKHLILFILLSVITFFAHGMAFAIACMACYALTVSHVLADNNSGKIKTLIHALRTLTLCLIPCLALLAKFAFSTGKGISIPLAHNGGALGNLIHFTTLINYSNTEAAYSLITAIVLVALFIAGVVCRSWTGRKLHQYDGLLLTWAVVLFVYVFFPDNIFGQGAMLINLRMQLYVFVFMCLCIAYLPINRSMLNAGVAVLLLCFAGNCIARIPTAVTAGRAEADVMGAEQYIKPYSTVLTMTFAYQGKDKNNKDISDRQWIFCHPANYVGAAKPLIMLDNYEANMGYFPLIWQYNVNPYVHLGHAIEGMAEDANISDYSNKTGVKIDFIVMFCFDSSALQNQKFAAVYKEVQTLYHVVYTSPAKRTILYELNQYK